MKKNSNKQYSSLLDYGFGHVVTISVPGGEKSEGESKQKKLSDY